MEYVGSDLLPLGEGSVRIVIKGNEWRPLKVVQQHVCDDGVEHICQCPCHGGCEERQAQKNTEVE